MMQGQIYRGVGDTVNILWKSKYQLLSAFKTVQLVYNHTVFLNKIVGANINYCTDYNVRSVELYANLTACIMRLHQLLHSAAPRAINSVRLAYITPLLTYLTATY